MNFPNLSRRGFIAAASALAATVSAAMSLPPGIKLLNETDNEEPVNLSKDWITDKGDYYIVHVPEGKTFSGEMLDKSTVFYTEQFSRVNNVSVMGFANVILLSDSCQFTNSEIDARNTRLASGKQRSVMVIDPRYSNGKPNSVFQGIHARGHGAAGFSVISANS